MLFGLPPDSIRMILCIQLGSIPTRLACLSIKSLYGISYLYRTCPVPLTDGDRYIGSRLHLGFCTMGSYPCPSFWLAARLPHSTAAFLPISLGSCSTYHLAQRR